MSDELTEARLRNTDLHPLERAYLLQRVGRFDPAPYREVASRWALAIARGKLPTMGVIRYPAGSFGQFREFRGYSQILWRECVANGVFLFAWEGQVAQRYYSAVGYTITHTNLAGPRGIKWVKVRENVLEGELMEGGWHCIDGHSPTGVALGNAERGETLAVQTQGSIDLILAQMAQMADLTNTAQILHAEVHPGPYDPAIVERLQREFGTSQ